VNKFDLEDGWAENNSHFTSFGSQSEKNFDVQDGCSANGNHFTEFGKTSSTVWFGWRINQK
jgi:hypothetical protein